MMSFVALSYLVLVFSVKDITLFVRCVFLRLTAGGADAETWAKNNGYTFIAQ